MADINPLIDQAIEHLLQDFRLSPQKYFTEEDVRCQLVKQIEAKLTQRNLHEVQLRDGYTSRLHSEYPTPFRCSMANRSFKVKAIHTKAPRGHFDIVLLNPSAAARCTFEVVRSQHYQVFRKELPQLPLPFLDCVIEVKLYRDLAHPNRTESPRQQAEYATQTIEKVAAVLEAQPEYYNQPFAQRGIVLMLDNSDLAYKGDIAKARECFKQKLKQSLNFNLLPGRLSAIWVTTNEIWDIKELDNHSSTMAKT